VMRAPRRQQRRGPRAIAERDGQVEVAVGVAVAGTGPASSRS
jgi:hypothetical protein